MGVHINKTVPFIFSIFPDFQLKLYGNRHLLNKHTLASSSGTINYCNTPDSSIGKKRFKIERWKGVNKNRRNCSASAWRVNEGRKLPDSELQVQQKDLGEAELWRTDGQQLWRTLGSERERGEESFALRHFLKDVKICPACAVSVSLQKTHFHSCLRGLVNCPVPRQDDRSAPVHMNGSRHRKRRK